jgi:DNA-binding NarL/FixJ family response regulator
MTVRVLIADDQQLVRAGFRLILERQPGVEVVGEATNGDEAVALAERLAPDVVLMDIRMPDLDGIQATRLILANPAAAGVRIVILTTFDLDEYVYDALKAGANGFLLKDLSPEQLVAAVLTVSQGDALLSPSVTRRLIESFTAVRRPAGRPPAVLSQLTRREMEVLELLATGLSNIEIAAKLFVAETTVKTHIARLLTKLGLRDRVQAVVFAYQSGLVGVAADAAGQDQDQADHY